MTTNPTKKHIADMLLNEEGSLFLTISTYTDQVYQIYFLFNGKSSSVSVSMMPEEQETLTTKDILTIIRNSKPEFSETEDDTLDQLKRFIDIALKEENF